MLSMAKAGTSTATTPGGAKTIVIAAPKGSTGQLSGTPHKIITSVPKIAGQGNTQFIVVSPQSSVGGGHTITSGGVIVHAAFNFCRAKSAQLCCRDSKIWCHISICIGEKLLYVMLSIEIDTLCS